MIPGVGPAAFFFRVFGKIPRNDETKRSLVKKLQKKKENEKKNRSGAGASRIWKFLPKQICSGSREERYDVDLRLLFYDFSQKASRFVRSIAVCSTTFRQDLLLHLLNPSHIISDVTALQAATQLEAA